MNIKHSFKHRIVNFTSGEFIRNIGWLGLAESINRIFRLGATLILPRFLTKHDYGLAALIITTYEFTSVFTRVGVGAKVIQVEGEHLNEFCETAYWLNWIIFILVFLIQCLAAFPIAWFYQDDALILPICVMSLIYLFSPLGRVQAALVMREKRLKITAFKQASVSFASNLATVLLAIGGAGMWAIVLPRVISAPLETLIYLYSHPWRRSGKLTLKHSKEILSFGSNYLGVGFLKTLKDNLDYLLVGRFLGVEALGIYFFAFNAGIGMSLSIIKSITTALYPQLCSVRESLSSLKATYYKSLKIISLIIIPFVFLQSTLAPFYVPLIFGEEWVPAIPILIVICLSAIPRPYEMASLQLLISIGQPRMALIWNSIFTILFTLILLIGVHWQATGVAIAVLTANFFFIPPFVLWINRYVFNRHSAG